MTRTETPSWWRRHMVALIVIVPTFAAMAWLFSEYDFTRWIRSEPVVVSTSDIGVEISLDGGTVTVVAANLAGSGDLENLYGVPEGAQVLLVQLAVDLPPESSCELRLDATVNGEADTWPLSTAGDIAYCAGSDGPERGAAAFVLPTGELTDASLLIGDDGDWVRVPLQP